MSVLVDWQIKERIASGDIKVDPFDEKLVNPASLDFRMGNKIGLVCGKRQDKISYKDEEGYTMHGRFPLIDPLDPESFLVNIVDRYEPFYLLPKHFILISALEDLTIPDDLCVKIYGKSSLARLGLANSEIAGWVDPAWSGVLTLELTNQHPYNAIKLTPGMKIGQYVFFTNDRPEKSYKETGRYYKQKPGQGSKGI